MRAARSQGSLQEGPAGEIKGFTGIDDPYEAPARPELRLEGGTKDADTLADEVIAHLERAGIIRALHRVHDDLESSEVTA